MICKDNILLYLDKMNCIILRKKFLYCYKTPSADIINRIRRISMPSSKRYIIAIYCSLLVILRLGEYTAQIALAKRKLIQPSHVILKRGSLSSSPASSNSPPVRLSYPVLCVASAVDSLSASASITVSPLIACTIIGMPSSISKAVPTA